MSPECKVAPNESLNFQSRPLTEQAATSAESFELLDAIMRIISRDPEEGRTGCTRALQASCLLPSSNGEEGRKCRCRKFDYLKMIS